MYVNILYIMFCKKNDMIHQHCTQRKVKYFTVRQFNKIVGLHNEPYYVNECTHTHIC